MLASSPLVSAISMVAAEPGGEEVVGLLGEIPRSAGDTQRLRDAAGGGVLRVRHVPGDGLPEDPGLRDPPRTRHLLQRTKEGFVQVDGRLLLLAPERLG